MDAPNASTFDPKAFPGIVDAMSEFSEANAGSPVDYQDVSDDMLAERVGFPFQEAAQDVSSSGPQFAQLQATLREASKGVSEGTDAEYKRLVITADVRRAWGLAEQYCVGPLCRLMQNCEAFLREMKWIQGSESFFSSTPHPEAPMFIVAWIMSKCDSINLRDGSTKAWTAERGTYGHAQKMRAAMTYAFGRLYGLGDMPWHQSEVSNRMLGNPSVSTQLSSYMCALRRRKIQQGEVAISARAVTPELLHKLYHHNHQSSKWRLLPYEPGSGVLAHHESSNEGSSEGLQQHEEQLHNWGGGRARRLLQAIYTTAYLCLLRSDEVLKIQLHDLEFFEGGVIIHLPFRKTHQHGEIKPFYLYALPESERHICAVRALSEWIGASRINSGYLFRKIASGDRINEANAPMTSEQFLELFRNNLLDVGVDSAPYGTHSFRRGGCQFLHVVRRWTLRRICEWGGWSQELTNLTIVKYLISQSDEPMEPRDQAFNPNRRPVVKCPLCGRSCSCA